MNMTVGELMRELEDLDEGTEVRLAMQPSWPFEYSVYGTYLRPAGKDLKPQAVVDAMNDDERARYEEQCEDGVYVDLSDPRSSDRRYPILYFSEGSQLGYLPGDVKRNIEW